MAWNESLHPRVKSGEDAGQFTDSDSSSVLGNAAPAERGELRKIYHTTSPANAIRMFDQGELKPLELVDKTASKDVYGDTDGGKYVYFGLSKAASTNNALAEGVTIRLNAEPVRHRAWVDKVAEGGIAMIKGPVSISNIQLIEVSGNSPVERAVLAKWEAYKRRQQLLDG